MKINICIVGYNFNHQEVNLEGQEEIKPHLNSDVRTQFAMKDFTWTNDNKEKGTRG